MSDIIKTRDGHTISHGDWLEDTTGMYEVRSIDSSFVYLKEVILDEDNPENYSFGDDRRLLHSEIRHMTYN